jgi:monovalent cation:H+ antiporter-2, CPA2 family
MTLRGIAEQVECPVLVCEAEDERFFAGQPIELVEALGERATYRKLTAADSAGGHCQVGASDMLGRVAVDWLEEVLAAISRRNWPANGRLAIVPCEAEQAQARLLNGLRNLRKNMEPDPILFRDLTYIFVAAVFGGLVAWRLHLPLILGFVLGGVAISPLTPGPRLSDVHTFEIFAEVGVVLLMFSIGVEFSVPELMRVKSVALLGAPAGILIMVLIALAAGRFMGWSPLESLVLGAAVSVASTMVLARLLSDSGHLTRTHGRVMIGITLIEDLAVICMTVVLPVLGNSQDGGWWAAARVLGKALLLLVPLIFVAIKVIPPLLRRVKKTCNPELLLLVAIAICLGTAALAQAVGFSVALGAFLAGLSISGLPELHDAHTQIIPLRDAFVALFFVTLGTLIDPKVLREHLPLLAFLVLLIVAGKFLVWSTVVRLFRYPLPTAIAVAAGLTQIGELSFVVVQVSRSAGLIGEGVLSTVIAASLISILLNSFVVRLVFHWLESETRRPQNKTMGEGHPPTWSLSREGNRNA